MKEVILEDATIAILNQAGRDGGGVRRKMRKQKCGIGKCWGLTFGMFVSSPEEKILISVRRKINSK